VGEGYPDLLVHLGEQRVVVELKAGSNELGEREEKQLRRSKQRRPRKKSSTSTLS